MPTTTLPAMRSPSRSAKLRRLLRAAVASAGVAVAVVGCSAGYDLPIPADHMAEGDRLCLADEQPSQGDVCTQDCLTATCAGATGRRICTCEGGVFLQCACLPPDNWPYQDVPAAPYCDRITGIPKYLAGERCTGEGLTCRSSTTPEAGCECREGIWQCGSSAGFPESAGECEGFGVGLQAILDDQPCDQEWQLCISRDYNPTGTSPRGCVCQADGAQLLWSCGATNRWWRAE